MSAFNLKLKFEYLYCLSLLAFLFSEASYADTLSEVQQRGYLRCGIIEGAPSLATINENGDYVGFNIDHCKTISAAVFGDIRIEYVSVLPSNVFTVLVTGGIDIFPDGASYTFTRDTVMGLDFIGVHMYAGQGFVVNKSSAITQLAEMDGATICIAQGTTNEQNVADYFTAHNMKYSVVTFANVEQALYAYLAKRCDAFTTERATIATRIAVQPRPEEHHILAETISKEPFGTVVRQNDSRWKDVAFWAFNTRVAAEELGITQANVDDMRANSKNLDVQRLLGVTGNFGEKLGVPNDWAYKIIKLVGNYNDLWQRHWTPVGLERGLNALYTDGGLMYAMPLR